MSRVDTAIRAAAGVTVAALAGIAGAISYSHMEELAAAHGEHGWRTHMFPLSVDLIEVVASLVLLADKRAGRRSGALPWAALIAGTTASFAANVAVGGADVIGRAVSGWPAFALLVAVKLLFGLLEHPSSDAAAGPALGTVRACLPDRPNEPGAVRADRDDDADEAARDRDDGDGAEDAAGARAYPGGRDSDRGTGDDGADAGTGRSAPTLAPVDVSVLLPAARAARATLARNGVALTRDALARQMRADGHAASNARVSALLTAIGAETVASGHAGEEATLQR